MHPVRGADGTVIRAGRDSDQGRTAHHQGPTLATPRHTNAPRPHNGSCLKVPVRHPVEINKGLETQGEGRACCGPIGVTN